MKLLIVVMIAVLMPLSSYSLTESGNTITLSEDERQACTMGGGCIVVPREVVMRYLAAEVEKAAKSCRKDSV